MTWRIQKPPGGPRVLLLEIFPSPFVVAKYIQQRVSNVNIFKCFLEVLNIIKCGTTIASLGSEVLSFYKGFCGLNSGPQVGQQELFPTETSHQPLPPIFLMCCFSLVDFKILSLHHVFSICLYLFQH